MRIVINILTGQESNNLEWSSGKEVFKFSPLTPMYGKTSHAFHQFRTLAETLCNYRDKIQSMRGNESLYIRFVKSDWQTDRDVGTGNVPSSVARNAEALIDAMIAYLNINLPKEVIISAMHYFFQQTPCCAEMFHLHQEEITRARKKKQPVPDYYARLLPRKYHPFWSYELHSAGSLVDDDTLHMAQQQLMQVVGWQSGSDDTIPGLLVASYAVDHTLRTSKPFNFLGINPAIIEAIRKCEHRQFSNLIITGGADLGVEYSFNDLHSLWTNIFADTLFTTAMYQAVDYGSNAQDTRFLRDVWERVGMICHNSHSYVEDRVNELWKVGLDPYIRQCIHT